MPLYEYLCRNCAHRFERIVKFSDAPLTTCPQCEKDEIEQVISAPAVQFKGSGWYVTDYARKNSASASSSSNKSDGGSDNASSSKDNGNASDSSSKDASSGSSDKSSSSTSDTKSSASSDSGSATKSTGKASGNT